MERITKALKDQGAVNIPSEALEQFLMADSHKNLMPGFSQALLTTKATQGEFVSATPAILWALTSGLSFNATCVLAMMLLMTWGQGRFSTNLWELSEAENRFGILPSKRMLNNGLRDLVGMGIVIRDPVKYNDLSINPEWRQWQVSDRVSVHRFATSYQDCLALL